MYPSANRDESLKRTASYSRFTHESNFLSSPTYKCNAKLQISSSVVDSMENALPGTVEALEMQNVSFWNVVFRNVEPSFVDCSFFFCTGAKKVDC